MSLNNVGLLYPAVLVQGSGLSLLTEQRPRDLYLVPVLSVEPAARGGARARSALRKGFWGPGFRV